MWQGEGWALRAVALLQLVLAGLFSSVGLGSESPDRECCDSLYPFIPIPEVATPKDYFDPYITESPNWNPPPVIDVTQEQQPIVTPRWLQPPEEPDSNWLFSTPRTTKKKKKTTKATTIRTRRPGMNFQNKTNVSDVSPKRIMRITNNLKQSDKISGYSDTRAIKND